MPSIGHGGLSLIHQLSMEVNSFEGGCNCCPYGYHIDLDFVPFSKKMLSREGDYERLKELKDKWRKERKSMDTLLGVDHFAPKIWDRNISSRDSSLWETGLKNKAWESDFANVINKRQQNLSSSSELILENGLCEAVTDFEEALQRTRPQSRILSYEIPNSQKFHTFPRIRGTSLKDPVTGQSITVSSSIFSNRGGSSSSNTSTGTVIMRDRPVSREINKKSEEERLGLREDADDKSLKDRLILLQQEIKKIPDLQEKLEKLMKEKKEISEMLEAEKSKCASMQKNLNNVNKAATPRTRNSRDSGVQNVVMTRDVGVSHVMPRTRTIAVGGNVDISTWDRNSRGDSSSPTGSLSGTLKRRVKTFDIGVQVKEYEFPVSETNRIPVLQIVEGIEFGVQVGSSGLDKEDCSQPSTTEEAPVIAPPRKKHTGTMAKPTQRDFGSTAMEPEPPKPMKPRVKHIGVSASLESIEELKPKPVEAQKSTKGVNTERSRTVNVGCNTFVPQKTFMATSSSQTEVQRESSPTTPTIAGVLKKRTMSLPVSVSTPSSSIPQQSVLSKSPTELKGISKIPRLSPSPVSSPVIPPRSQNLRNIPSPSNMDRAESPVSSVSSGTPSPSPGELLSSYSPMQKKPIYQRSDTYTKDVYMQERQPFGTLEPLEEEDREGPRSSSASSSSGCVPQQEKREKVSPSKEMQAALKVLNDALLRGKTTQQVTNAISIILHEWFRIAGTKTANPFDVEDYLDSFEIYSPQLLRYIVNMPDGNGNTALHYAVSHGNFDVVSILLDSKVCDPNKANKAGYTSIMLVALANISCESHRQVVRRLFSLGDVNIKAAQHGQTALMLGASHGRFDTVRLLLEAGAAINIQDEDGSTALMCAAEHGHMKIVKYLLAHPDCDLEITDSDGSTAFSIAMEGQHKDIGVLLYAQMHFASPESGGNNKSRSTTPSASSKNSSASSSAHTSPLATKRQQHS